MRPDTILQGVVGSMAYGLAHEGSDTDRLGIFVAPTYEVAGLDWHPSKETRAGDAGGDHTEHEVGKYLRLALKANPTVTELLWLPDHEVATAQGRTLVAIRDRLLATDTVLPAYLGYARAQAGKIQRTASGSYRVRVRDTPGRLLKHARHCLRLLEQAEVVLRTGHLEVRVADPDVYERLGNLSVAQFLVAFETAIDRLRTEGPGWSVLPDEPDRDTARRTLAVIRRSSDITEVGAHWFKAPPPPPPAGGDDYECCASGSCEVCRR